MKTLLRMQRGQIAEHDFFREVVRVLEVMASTRKRAKYFSESFGGLIWPDTMLPVRRPKAPYLRG